MPASDKAKITDIGIFGYRIVFSLLKGSIRTAAEVSLSMLGRNEGLMPRQHKPKRRILDH